MRPLWMIPTTFSSVISNASAQVVAVFVIRSARTVTNVALIVALAYGRFAVPRASDSDCTNSTYCYRSVVSACMPR